MLDVFPKVRPALVETVVEIGRADERLCRGVPSGAEGDLCIDAADAVGADDAAIVSTGGAGHGSKFPVRIDEPDGGLLTDIVIHAQHTEIGFGAGERVSRSNGLARGLIVRKEGADRPWTLLAREAQAVIGVGDAASKNKIYGSGEIARIFEKEWTFFRKENLETLVDGDLRLVGFNLGKIRIQSSVEHQGILEHDLGIEAGAWFEALPNEMGDAAGTIIQAAERAQRTVGNELYVAPGRDFFESIRMRFLAQPALGVAADMRVEGEFEVAADVALKEDAPGLFGISGKTERTERNLEPHHEALRRNLAQ